MGIELMSTQSSHVFLDIVIGLGILQDESVRIFPRTFLGDQKKKSSVEVDVLLR